MTKNSIKGGGGPALTLGGLLLRIGVIKYMVFLVHFSLAGTPARHQA